MDLSAIAHFFISPPGALIAQLISLLALVVLFALTFLRLKRGANREQARHILIGSIILLLIQAIQFGSSLLSPAPIASATAGVIERVAAALTILWGVWLFYEADQRFIRTGLCILLTVVVGFSGALSLVIINLQPQIQIMPIAQLDLLWQITSVLAALGALIFIFIQRPELRWVALSIFTLLGLGHGLQTLLIDGVPGPMGLVRLAQSLSLPLFLFLIKRIPVTAKAMPASLPPAKPAKPGQPVDTKPKLVDLLLQINLQEEQTEKQKATVRAISLSVVADICYLAQLSPEGDEVHLIAGYDLIRETFLPPATVKRGELLHITDAWEDQRVQHLSQVHADTPDANTLTMLLKYHRIGNLLAYPLHFPGQPTIGGIIILSPYTGKQWDEQTRRLLDEVQDTLTQVLFGADPLDNLKAELDQQTEMVSLLQQSSEHLTKALSEKEALISSLQSDLKQLKAKYQIEKLETVKQMDALSQEMAIYQSQTSSQQDFQLQLDQLTAQIRQITSERDQLRTALDRANARIKDLETQTGQTGPTRLSMDNQIISLDSIAANVRLSVASGLQEKRLTLEIDNPDGRQMIKTDPELLQTVCQGLLENAIEAAPAGSTVHLHQNLSLETGMLIAEVTDHGDGLTQQEQTVLFNTPDADLPGIGSLPAIRNAIRAIRVLSGKIWLRSQKDQFTTFRIQLPVRIID